MMNLENMPLVPLELVKRHIRVTWSDDDTDMRIVTKMLNAERTLNHKLGAACDYLAPGAEQQLFLNYMFYSWNEALDEFDGAYVSEIIQIRQIHEVRKERYDEMKFKSKFETYNDGVLFICTAVNPASNFNADENPLTRDDLKNLVKLDYAAVSKRERDLEFAQTVGSSLDLKVKTRRHASANTSKKVLIGNVLYDIFQVDESVDGKEMYLYLQKARELQKNE